MIAAGQHVTLSVAGSANGFWFSPTGPWTGVDTDQLRSAVNNDLLSYMRVIQFTIKQDALFDPGTWTYTATLVVAPLVSHATAADVAAIVAHWFYQETGYLPNVSIPSEGDPYQPQPEPGDDPFSKLGSGIMSAILLLGLIFIGATYAFGKSGGRLL